MCCSRNQRDSHPLEYKYPVAGYEVVGEKTRSLREEKNQQKRVTVQDEGVPCGM
jgi:hypothetical protein